MKSHLLDAGPPSVLNTLLELVQLLLMCLVATWAAAILVCSAYFAIVAIWRLITGAARMIWGC